ncbi:hypothetical protein BTVI_113143 [Pitangus sulphuratus]|nr:hypothetical protein BTVI_113143 [Pitangus sulphuratus]
MCDTTNPAKEGHIQLVAGSIHESHGLPGSINTRAGAGHLLQGKIFSEKQEISPTSIVHGTANKATVPRGQGKKLKIEDMAELEDDKDSGTKPNEEVPGKPAGPIVFFTHAQSHGESAGKTRSP